MDNAHSSQQIKIESVSSSSCLVFVCLFSFFVLDIFAHSSIRMVWILLKMDLYVCKYVLSFVNVCDWNTFGVLRLLCKDVYEWLMDTRWFVPMERLYPVRSFVCMSRCMSCERHVVDPKVFTMPNTYYPRPVFVYCKRFECVRHVVRSMVTYADESSTVLLAREAVKDACGKVLRSSGALEDCVYDLGYLFKDTLSIRCRFGYFLKDVPIQEIPMEYRQTYVTVRL